MNIHELIIDWDIISPKKKIEALESLTNHIKYDTNAHPEDEDYILKSIFLSVVDAEDDDYFGTEGLKI